jgi:hypothetical protein
MTTVIPGLDAQQILATMIEANLVDDQRTIDQNLLPAKHALHEAGRFATGRKTQWSSPRSDSEVMIDAYFITVDVWDSAVTAGCGQNILKRYFDYADYLIGIAGPGWSIVVERGNIEAEIPKNLTSLILAAVGIADVVWQRPIPAAAWFTSDYELASEISMMLQNGIAACQHEDASSATTHGQTTDEFIRESRADDSFAAAVITVALDAFVTLHIFVDNYWAAEMPLWIENYVTSDRAHICVAGDGWVVRLTPF